MRSRRGFTISEIIISLMLLSVLMGVAVQFLRKQTELMSRVTSRMDAMQNAQFATSQIDRELREAGAGVADARRSAWHCRTRRPS
jgi:prepilin-type N-terminal cleavage/methylation domain-containing protein